MKHIEISNPEFHETPCGGMRRVKSRRIDAEAGSIGEERCVVVEETVLRLD